VHNLGTSREARGVPADKIEQVSKQRNKHRLIPNRTDIPVHTMYSLNVREVGSIVLGIAACWL
jgi:hypothetical protein